MRRPQRRASIVQSMQWPITEEWRALARDALQREGLNQSVIAARLGISQSTVQRIFHGPSATSEHVPAIARMLGVPPPLVASPESAVVDANAWCEAWRGAFDSLSPAQRQILLTLSEELQRK